MADKPKGILGRADDALNSVFGPINRGMASIGLQPQSPMENLLMALSAIAPGRGIMAPKMPVRNQPGFTPNSQDLILEMLVNNANRHGVLQSTRSEMAQNAPFRGNSFNPEVEAGMRSSDAMLGTRVLTPANRSPADEYNLALMRRLNIRGLDGGGGQ